MRCFTPLLLIFLLCWCAAARAQLARSIVGPEHPAIGYGGAGSADPVAQLSANLVNGRAELRFENGTGYLRSLLAALEIPVESQIAVFSKTSLQSPLIDSRNPRTIFFNDAVTVAWMRGGFIEIAAHDPQQGAVFYALPQGRGAPARLLRDNSCLQCHYSAATLGVPGFLARSIPSGADGSIMPWLGNYTTSHQSPLEERWGGWYVTGRTAGRHLGNATVPARNAAEPPLSVPNADVPSLEARFDTDAYLTPHSDIVALLVFNHQVHMMNLLTRLGWEARVLSHDNESLASSRQWQAAVEEFVDYLLFVDEAPIEAVRGSSGFAERFAASGPRDRRGRSLRDFDLQSRVFRYRCSYMIYSAAFDRLPGPAKESIYRRMWDVLGGSARSGRYAALPAAERAAIVEILRETKKDLPSYYSTISQSP